MGDVALKQWQVALEGAYTAGGGSVYNGGTAQRAVRRFACDKAVDANWKPTWEAPVEARGTYAGQYTHLLQMMEVDGKIPALVYPDDMTYIGRMLISGNPLVTTLPLMPTVLLAATTLASGGNSLTTQPNAAADGAFAKSLAVTLSNVTSNTTPVVITIAGLDVFGNAISDILPFTVGTTTPSYTGGGAAATSCTLYTKNYYATVTALGITSSAQPSGDQIAVGGVNAYLWKFTPDMGTSTLQSGTAEYFDGSAAWQLPGVVFSKGTFDAQIGKTFKFDGTYSARSKQLLVAAAASVNPAAATGAQAALTNISDSLIAAISTYKTLFYADPFGNVPGATLVNARLIDFKLDIDMAVKMGKSADGTPYPSFVARDYYGPKLTAEMTLLFNSFTGTTSDPAELAQFLAFNSRTVRAAFPGFPLPCGILSAASGWPTPLLTGGFGGAYGAIFDIAGKYETANEKDVDGRIAMSFKMSAEVDLQVMGAPMVATFVSRINPNM